MEELRKQVDQALAAKKPAEAVCFLSEMVAREPGDRHIRLALAIALGDAGNPQGALKVMRALADRLAHDGLLLPAMVVIRQGVERAGDDAGLISALKRLHVKGIRAKAGNLPTPPPLKARTADQTIVTAPELLALPLNERLEKIAQLGTAFPPTGPAAIPLPLPLFGELEEDAFLETFKNLRYRRLPAGSKLLVEGQPGDTLLVVASGHVEISKGGTKLAKIGPGSVLGEMALITGAPRSATAVASEEVEIFELPRESVRQLAAKKPKIADELFAYCRNRLIGNIVRTSPLFSKFDEATQYLIVDRFQRKGFNPKDRIIVQGQAGAGIYVLVMGEVEVSVAKEGQDPVVVANLGAGEVFGEISLLHDRPATATVSARDQVGLLFLPRDEFQKVLNENPAVKAFLESLGENRLKATESVQASAEVLEADDLIVL